MDSLDASSNIILGEAVTTAESSSTQAHDASKPKTPRMVSRSAQMCMDKLDECCEQAGPDDAQTMAVITKVLAAVVAMGDADAPADTESEDVVTNAAFAVRQASVAQAKDAILDWLETHGGEIILSGPNSNLAALSDAVAWGQRFHGDVGRLLPFLHQFGSFSAADGGTIIDIQL